MAGKDILFFTPKTVEKINTSEIRGPFSFSSRVGK
jgi:hypothetical protein